MESVESSTAKRPTPQKTEPNPAKKTTTKKRAQPEEDAGEESPKVTVESNGSPSTVVGGEKKKPAAPRKKAATTTSEGGAGEQTDTVYNYLVATNRPYNSTAIFENLHREISQIKLKKILDELVLAGKLQETGETSKVYFVNQQLIPIPSEEETKQEAAEVERLTALLTAQQNAHQVALTSLQMTQNEPSEQDFPRLLSDLIEFNKSADASLEKHNALVEQMKQNQAGQVDLGSLQKQLRFYQKMEKERKSGVMQIVNEICAQTGETLKAAMEKCGIE